MEKKNNPKKTERKWYASWLKKGYFKADPKSSQKPFVMIMPPPNLTGELHLGHALQHTLSDALIRFKRMQGFDTLWLPGVDHAGIQMQATMEKKLEKEEQKTRAEIGDKEFLKYIWKWARIYEKRILKQAQRIGESADWSRKRFTLDPEPQKAVYEEFIRLYNEGLIYKGPYIVHYCTKCQTAITDLELEYQKIKGKLYHIRYPFKDNPDKSLTVATTRPETMLGDTAVAVYPQDKKYKGRIGKTLILPLVQREIPLLADAAVDPKFGTGAIKVTPAHDLTDYEIGTRHNLDAPIVISREGKMINVPKKYKNLSINQARKIVINDLKRQGFLKKTEDYIHSVAVCERCKSVVEPLISVQWFVKMKKLAEPAIKAIAQKKVKFLPERFTKQAREFLLNIRDWCISRQLIWGHPLPVFYCPCSKKPIVSATKPKQCPHCQSKSLKQEKDVLDTWFSSGLWPLSTLGWPDEQSLDLEKYYPSDLMVTAPGIFYLWICRMIMLGLKFKKDIPFRTVFIHGTLRDEKGRKMSKSLGNGVDPLEMINKYSADSLRIAMALSTYPGRDIKISKQAMEDKIRAGRNFTTKVYNAAKLIIEKTEPLDKPSPLPKSLADDWIYSRLHYTINRVTTNLETYQIARALRRLYHFFWNEFCDWYLEIAKERIYSKNSEEQKVSSFILRDILEKSLRLLHPFAPFITTELHHHLDKKSDLIVEKWPTYASRLRNKKAELAFAKIQDVVSKIRIKKSKAATKLPPEQKAIVDFLTRNFK